MTRGKKAVVGVLVLGAVGALVGGNLAMRKEKGKPVALHTVKREDVIARVSCRGKVQAKRKVEISANVMGQIVNLAVREGDEVKKDQFLLQIDQTQLKAQATGSEAALQALLADRDAARANAQQADADSMRAEKNYRENIVSEADFQRVRSAREGAHAGQSGVERRIEQARAMLEASKDSLSKTTIRAPIEGIVTALPVEEGEVAVVGTMNNPGTKLMTISDMSVVEAEMEVDETDVPRVVVGQRATLRVDAFPDQEFEGTVSEIGSSPIVRVGSTTQAIEFSVKVVLKNPPGAVRPGFSVSGEIETGERHGVVAIPVQALVVQDLAEKVAKAESAEREETLSKSVKKVERSEKDIEGVFQVVAGKATFAAVKTGLQGDLVIEIVEGLDEGVSIIQGPYRTLRTLKDGEAVREEKAKKDGDKKKADG